VPGLQKSSFSSTGEDSNNNQKSQPAITLPGDSPTSVPPLLLIVEQLALCSTDARDLQRFAEWIYFGRSRWLARHKKTLPDPDWRDRQRYGTKRREAVNG